MNKLLSRITPQAIAARRQQKQLTVRELCKQAGISDNTYYAMLRKGDAPDGVKQSLIDVLGFQDGDSDVIHPADQRHQSNGPPAAGGDPGAEIEIRLTRGLSDFARVDQIPYHHVLFLADLHREIQDVSPVGTGQTIDTPDQWRVVYAALKPYL